MAISSSLNAVIAVVVVVCGVVYSLLVGLLYRKVGLVLTAHSNLAIYPDKYHAPYWIAGFSFIIPGVVGGIASFYRMKGGYVTQVLFNIAGLATMAALFLGALPPISAETIFNFKTCSHLPSPSISLSDRACTDLRSISGLGVGAGVMAVVGWVFLLISVVIGIWYACSTQTRDRLDINQHLMYLDAESPKVGAYAIQTPRYYDYGGYSNPSYLQHGGYVLKVPRYATGNGYARSLPRYVHQPRYITQPDYSPNFAFRPVD